MQEEKKKLGRPTDNPRTSYIQIRLTPEEADMLAECAKLSGLTKTGVLIEGLKLYRQAHT